MSLEEFGYREELRRGLTTRDLIIYGMIFMLPIAPFSVYGFVWDAAKGMVPLAYLLGLVGMVFTALSYAALSRAFPLAGSVYTYASRGLHEVAGFFSGWLILLDYMLVPSLLYLFSAVALRPLVPGAPTWMWLGGFIAFNAAANMIGIEFTARVNRFMLVLELATLAAFLAMGLIALYRRGEGAGGLTWAPIYDPRVFSWATVSGATSIAVLSFLGFDGISTLAEENRGTENAVGRATVIALILIGALFMLQTWVATDLARGMHFSSPETAFYEIAERAGGTWLRLVVIVAVVIASAIANAMAAQAAVARILFAMARDRKLPAVLAKVHPRFKTPYISTLVVAGVSALVGAFFFQRIEDLTRVVNFGALSGFVLLHLSVINYFFVRQRSGDWLRHLVFPLIGLAIILYVLYEMDRAAKILGACWIAIGALYYGVLALRGKHLMGAEFGRQRMIYTLGDRRIETAGEDYYVAPDASVIGSVRFGAGASVWFNCVLRGDSDWINLGEAVNVQDGTIIHTDEGEPVTLGSRVSVGHGAMLHGCTVGASTLIANGAMVLDRARIGSHCVIGARALVTPGKIIPDGSVVMGSPGQVVREVNDKDLKLIEFIADHYRARINQYRRDLKVDPRSSLGR